MSERGDEFQRWPATWRVAFSGQNWQALIQAFGAVLGDQAVADSEQAVREGLAALGQDETAAGLIGNDKTIPRGPSESVAAYRSRLAYAVPLSRQYGTPLGLLLALHYMDFPGGVLLTQNGIAWHLTGSPVLQELVDSPAALPTWCEKVTLGDNNPAIPASTDGKPAIAPFTIPWASITGGPMDAEGDQFNGRFVLVFPDGSTGDGDLSIAANLDRLRRTIRTWRPMRCICAGIYVTTAGSVWDWPAGRTWDDGGGAWWDVDTFSYYTA